MRRTGKTPYRGTEVTTGRTQEAIRLLLKKYDAGTTRFTMAGMHITMEFIRHGQGYRIAAESLGLDEKSERQIWRVVFYWLKSKLEVVNFGLMEFETEFLPYALISGGQTVNEAISPRLAVGREELLNEGGKV